MGLTKHQEGWKKGGALLGHDKLVCRAGSLALATSYTHKLVTNLWLEAVQ